MPSFPGNGPSYASDGITEMTIFRVVNVELAIA